MKQQKGHRIHRFHDTVALSLDDTETLYLSPQHALTLGMQLVEYACDIYQKPFAFSQLNTREYIDENN